MMVLEAILGRVERARSAGVLPIVVFDLDSTLIETASRHLAILREFVETEWSHDPAVVDAVKSLTPAEFRWHVGGPLRARGLDDPGLHRALLAFWMERFFHDDYLRHDTAAPGAVAYVKAVVKRGGLAYYLTARPLPGMGLGTVASLVQLGFPYFDGLTVLQLKPSPDLDDAKYKKSAHETIAAYGGEVVATFENEPGHLNALLANFPNAVHVHYKHVHSPSAPVARPEIHHIETFHLGEDG
jgi:hypothetical protein